MVLPGQPLVIATPPEPAATALVSQPMRALVVGATGQVGRHVLAALLADDAFSSVHEYGRRTTRALDHPKLKQKLIDFEDLHRGDFVTEYGRGFDVVFITLGTSATTNPAHVFEKVDREYVLRVAAAAKINNPNATNGDVPDGTQAGLQHVIYCSTTGASPTSRFLYTRSKGLTELGLARLGYASTTIFRPAFLADAQHDLARGDRQRGLLEAAVGLFAGALSRVSNGVQVPVETLGRAMVHVGRERGLGKSPLVGKEETILGSMPQDQVKGAAREEGRAWVLGNADTLAVSRG